MKTTDEIILEAAEDIFIEKGYSGTRMTEIAEKANVNHAMLHYYFRTKMELFKVVFNRQVERFSEIIKPTILNKPNIDIKEIVKHMIKMHFNIVKQHPKSMLFIMNEINNNAYCKSVWEDTMRKKFQPIIENLSILFNINQQDDKMNILVFIVCTVSINLLPLTFLPLFRSIVEKQEGGDIESFLDSIQQENIRIALSTLKYYNII